MFLPKHNYNLPSPKVINLIKNFNCMGTSEVFFADAVKRQSEVVNAEQHQTKVSQEGKDWTNLSSRRKHFGHSYKFDSRLLVQQRVYEQKNLDISEPD